MPESHLIEAAITRQIIGAFYYVYNQLGYGFAECVYRRAVVHVLRRTGVAVAEEFPVSVCFEDVVVGEFRADLIVAERVVVELKVAERFHPAHDAQLLNYLRATGLQVGLLLNFGPQAAYRRLVVTRDAKRYYATVRSTG